MSYTSSSLATESVRRSLQSPPTTIDRILTLIALLLLAIQAALDAKVSMEASAGVAVLTLLLTLLARQVGSRECQTVPTLVFSLVMAQQGGTPWPIAMILALMGSILLVGGVTPLALTSWLLWTTPDLSDLTQSPLLKVPKLWLVIGSLLFSVINPALEELIWRGVLQTQLRAQWGLTVTLLLQALSFGLQHLHGFPRGVIGVVLATLWAIPLGLLRHHTSGLAGRSPARANSHSSREQSQIRSSASIPRGVNSGFDSGRLHSCSKWAAYAAITTEACVSMSVSRYAPLKELGVKLACPAISSGRCPSRATDLRCIIAPACD